MKYHILTNVLVMILCGGISNAQSFVDEKKEYVTEDGLVIRTRYFEGTEMLVGVYLKDGKADGGLFVLSISKGRLWFTVPDESRYWIDYTVPLDKSDPMTVRIAKKGSKYAWIISRIGACRYKVEKE